MNRKDPFEWGVGSIRIISHRNSSTESPPFAHSPRLFSRTVWGSREDGRTITVVCHVENPLKWKSYWLSTIIWSAWRAPVTVEYQNSRKRRRDGSFRFPLALWYHEGLSRRRGLPPAMWIWRFALFPTLGPGILAENLRTGNSGEELNFYGFPAIRLGWDFLCESTTSFSNPKCVFRPRDQLKLNLRTMSLTKWWGMTRPIPFFSKSDVFLSNRKARGANDEFSFTKAHWLLHFVPLSGDGGH